MHTGQLVFVFTICCAATAAAHKQINNQNRNTSVQSLDNVKFGQQYHRKCDQIATESNGFRGNHASVTLVVCNTSCARAVNHLSRKIVTCACIIAVTNTHTQKTTTAMDTEVVNHKFSFCHSFRSMHRAHFSFYLF